MPEGVWTVIVIDSGLLQYSAVFWEEAKAEQALVTFMKWAHPNHVPETVTNWDELTDCFEGGGDDLDLHFLYELVK
jgi:hypothetical protein